MRTDVAFVEAQVLARQLPDPVQALGVGVAQIIHDHDAVAAVQKLHAGVGADIAGTAGDQYIHGDSSFKSPVLPAHFKRIVLQAAVKCKGKDRFPADFSCYFRNSSL